MQRFINDPNNVVEDMLQGYEKAHPEVKLSDLNSRVLTKTSKSTSKVGVVSGGGSGHEPAFLGYIGEGMLDTVAIGEVFASPPAQSFYDAIIEANSGEGVAILFGNYEGDNMNVKMAVQMATDEDIDVEYVVANDDIASSPKETKEKRHGIAGGFFMWKAGGAKAALGGSLQDVIMTAKRVVERTRSICVGIEPLVIPASGSPNFTIEKGKMEFGIGHHGETGIRVEKLTSATEIANKMTAALLEDFEFNGPKKLAVMISGLGSTPSMELYILYNSVAEKLNHEGHQITKTYIGDFVTSLDMNGVSLTIVELDEEIEKLLEYPAKPVGLKGY